MRGLGRARAAAGAVATAMACAGGLTACGASEPTFWVEPADYTYEATIDVFGPASGEWRITVRDHAVAEIEPLDDIARYSEADLGATVADFLTFAQYEDWWREARDQGAAVAELDTDDAGALRSLELDMREDTADDEYLVVVSGVTVP